MAGRHELMNRFARNVPQEEHVLVCASPQNLFVVRHVSGPACDDERQSSSYRSAGFQQRLEPLLRRDPTRIKNEASLAQTVSLERISDRIGSELALAHRVRDEDRGRPIALAVPENTPPEKKALLRFLGAELLEVEDELCPLFPTEGARGVVKSLVESPAYEGRYVSPNQYENELNVEAHYRTTGPEIWQQTEGRIDYFFAGFGTCGTITGVGRYLKEQNPDIRIIGVEPAHRQHQLSGLKKITTLPPEHAPRILDESVLDEIVTVEDRDACETGILLARREGIMAGPTTGALLFAARRFGAGREGTAVVISPDGAARYASVYAPYLEG